MSDRVPAAGGLGRRRVETVLAHRESRHAIKYGIVGVTNTLLDYAVYALLVSAGVWYVAAKALSMILATLNGYTFNRRWTFRAGRHDHGMLARYIAVQGTGLGVNIAILTFLVEVVGLGPVVAQAIAIPFVAAYCFLSNRLWTFGPNIPPA